MRIIYKEVGKDPVEKEIENELETMQKLVGGPIESTRYMGNLVIICNEEGKLKNLKPNIKLGYDCIVGNCFVVQIDLEISNFKSINDNQIEYVIKDLKQRSVENGISNNRN